MTPGEVLLELIAEVTDWVSPTFDAEVESDGEWWDQAPE